jgi:uncharacterized protein (TIGR00369 family)
VTADLSGLAYLLQSRVPFVGHLGIVYAELTTERCVCTLADDPEWHNHLGGPHAGAMFTLAETASAGVLLAAYAEQLGELTPLPSVATIAYKKVAKGAITATAKLGRDPDEVLGKVRDEGRAVMPVTVEITNAAGETTGEMTVDWHLRRND